ncbi:LysM peptidoglycan-binding domain-containing protein [Microbacterium sp. ET2]|uniref:lytic transglycosylase n=1 Tax=Microbacterium albipurpureum TaxID=3050384 RepID=UPI00259D1486|nr:LysM peptidoglycan-binding domain-containing protein [Microbacterium sp. ET2 (Ac-2212)]WJL95380.1 LysM peptidoglycan-binding domain-containing protein [Microbacterium sp. ET2 (Ac-2212)]
MSRSRTVRLTTARLALPATALGALAVAMLPAPPATANEAAPLAREGAGRSSLGTASSVDRAPVILPAHSAGPESVVVQAGDTISAIAARHGLRTTDVLALNGLGWSSVIHPGQVIRLSGGSAPPAAPPAPAAPSAPAATTAYTVVAGDTISAIARRHGVSTQAVLDANSLQSSSIIYPGQAIAIPSATAPAPAAAPSPAPAPVLAAETVTLDDEQIGNVRTIIAVGRERGVSERGIAIALGTAMVESWLRNLDWGDRDSLGLFQQRPSTGWGSADEVRDPVRATAAFFGGPADPNGSRTRGLLDIPGWESMSFAGAAQAVQISAFPDRYAKWEAPAYAWLATYG